MPFPRSDRPGGDPWAITTRFIDSTATAGEGADRPGSSVALARALLAFEAEFEAERPARIVLTDASDASLAAALVAAKLLIPLGATAEATASGEANAALIAQLADAYTPSA